MAKVELGECVQAALLLQGESEANYCYISVSHLLEHAATTIKYVLRGSDLLRIVPVSRVVNLSSVDPNIKVKPWLSH